MSSPQPNDRWYYAKDKQKVGPITLAQLRRQLSEGVLNPVDMAVQEGSQKWRPLRDVVVEKSVLKHAGIIGKRSLAVGAVASAGVILLALSCCGLVAVLMRSGKTVDVGVVAPVAENPNEVEEKGGPSKGGDVQDPKDETPTGEPNPEFTSTKKELSAAPGGSVGA